MTTTPNIGVTDVEAAQNQKEVTINAGFARLDAAITEELAVSVSAGNATPSTAAVQQAARIAITGASTSGRTVTLPAVQRPLIVSLDSASTHSVAIVRGSTSIALYPGVTGHFYVDGTTNGLVQTAEFSVQRGALWIAAAPSDAEVLWAAEVPPGETWTLLPDLRGWVVEAEVAATGTTVIDITRNGAGVATLTWSAAGTAPALATASNIAQSFTAGQVMKIVAESPADATLAQIRFHIFIVRANA